MGPSPALKIHYIGLSRIRPAATWLINIAIHY